MFRTHTTGRKTTQDQKVGRVPDSTSGRNQEGDDQEGPSVSGDQPQGAGGQLCKQARVEGDRGGRSAQHPCRGVQDDQPS